MKLNKTFGRAAATLVAAAMLASLAAPAYAADPAQGAAGGSNLSTVTINKLLYMPSDVTTPTETFAFTITGATVADGETINIDGTNTRNLYTGVVSESEKDTVGGSVEVSAAGDAANRTADGNTGNDVYAAEVALTLPSAETFTKAGVYKYDINETDPTNPDITEVTSAGLDLYLIVERENPETAVNAETDTYKITGAFIYADGETYDADAEDGQETAAKTADYINNYKLDAEGSTVGSLEFKKTINGAMASMGDTFDFTVTGSELTEGETYKYVKNNAQIDSTITVENGKLSFEDLTNGDTITIKGLDAGSYTVEEADNDMGYVVSYKVDGSAGAQSGDTASMTVTAKNKVSAEFFNTRNAVSPTGLAMDIAPYALLVVIAAAGCFFFVRKRRED